MDEVNKPELSYKRMQIRFVPERNLHLNAWIGAVLRNNFGIHAANVATEDGKSLYQHIAELPLSPTHPLYGQFSGGFPKGIWLDCRDLVPTNKVLLAGEVYSFSAVMVGTCVQYTDWVKASVVRMLDEGIGSPKVRSHVLEMASSDDAILHYSDFALLPDAPQTATVKIDYVTPICLSRQRGKKDASVSYQDKLNGFPSFYQLLRSVVSRVNTLGTLYGNGPLVGDINDYLVRTSDVYLTHANLTHRRLRSTPKQGRNTLYVLEGYDGSTVWNNVPIHYLPMLAFATGLSVGYNISFGLGSYTLDVR